MHRDVTEETLNIGLIASGMVHLSEFKGLQSVDVCILWAATS